MLEEKDLQYEPVWEFEYVVLMSSQHPIAGKEKIEYSELRKYIEITHGDIIIPSLSLSKARQLRQTEESKKEISVYERGSQFELLRRIPTTYMWVSPIPQKVLEFYSFVQKKCEIYKNKYKDVLVYRKDYRLSKADKMFIEKLQQAVKDVSGS